MATNLKQNKTKPLTTASATEEAEPQEVSHAARGIVTSTAMLQNDLAVSYKVKNTFNKGPSNRTPLYLPELNENSCLRKNLYINV